MEKVSRKKMLRIGLSALAVAILFGIWISVWATNQTNASYRSLPFPNELKRYEARIFTLLDKSAVDNTTKQSQYDAEFAKQFKEVLKPYLKLDPKLEKKLLSGPAPEGKFIEINEARYFFYQICQAHECNVTNIAVLYQFETKKVVARLQYKCDVYLMNNPSKNEVAAIDDLAPIDKADSFYQRACEYEKRIGK